jgi:hypothetical protein
MKKVIAPPKDLNSLALDAATELEARIGNRDNHAGKSRQALAQELCELFPASKQRPNLSPETIGIVCGVVGGWSGGPNRTGYAQFNQSARQIAELLVAPRLSQREIERLVQFCHALFYATQVNPIMHDVPDDIPNIV